MIAAISGHIDIVLALIKANANVNDKNEVNIN
jgi:ankyrin repeat protein